MAIFDFLFKNKNNSNDKKNKTINSLEFSHNNIVYPKNTQEEETNKLCSEIKQEYNTTENKISASYKKFETRKNHLECKYTDNILKKNKYLHKQFATYVSEKEKYKILEAKVNVVLEKGDDIFVKNE